MSGESERLRNRLDVWKRLPEWLGCLGGNLSFTSIERLLSPLIHRFRRLSLRTIISSLIAVARVFKQTAPVIKLPADAMEDDYLGQLGLFNSSVACFWFKQVCHNKGGRGRRLRRQTRNGNDFYAFNATTVAELSTR